MSKRYLKDELECIDLEALEQIGVEENDYKTLWPVKIFNKEGRLLRTVSTEEILDIERRQFKKRMQSPFRTSGLSQKPKKKGDKQ